MKTDLLERWT